MFPSIQIGPDVSCSGSVRRHGVLVYHIATSSNVCIKPDCITSTEQFIFSKQILAAICDFTLL